MKIGITGATGHLGNLVIGKLKERVPVSDIVALTRSPQKAANLGVETREFDYDKPGNLPAALSGIDSLLLISASEVGKRERQHTNVIEAAKKAGVKWIVYTSLLRADSSSLSLASEHYATEEKLKKSGIAYTILRNGWYTENYTGSVPNAVKGGAFIGSAGDGKIASATRDDYAEAAAVVLTGRGHEGKIYELAGDDAYTLSDLAAEISRQTGKDIPYKNLPENEYASALKSFGIPDGYATAIAGWDISTSKGALFDNKHQLSALIGRPTTSLSSAVKEALAS
ncbi:MAG TPA: SDR family oxidoreductase [Bacteroidales bacterium]|nr:SDR family oxidoreductase [Bacteroidales bacterium]